MSGVSGLSNLGTLLKLNSLERNNSAILCFFPTVKVLGKLVLSGIKPLGRVMGTEGVLVPSSKPPGRVMETAKAF
jgi:hypothetical protein